MHCARRSPSSEARILAAPSALAWLLSQARRRLALLVVQSGNRANGSDPSPHRGRRLACAEDLPRLVHSRDRKIDAPGDHSGYLPFAAAFLGVFTAARAGVAAGISRFSCVAGSATTVAGTGS